MSRAATQAAQAAKTAKQQKRERKKQKRATARALARFDEAAEVLVEVVCERCGTRQPDLPNTLCVSCSHPYARYAEPLAGEEPA